MTGMKMMMKNYIETGLVKSNPPGPYGKFRILITMTCGMMNVTKPNERYDEENNPVWSNLLPSL